MCGVCTLALVPVCTVCQGTCPLPTPPPITTPPAVTDLVIEAGDSNFLIYIICGLFFILIIIIPAVFIFVKKLRARARAAVETPAIDLELIDV